MNPERWQAVGDIFEQALAAPTGQRTMLIDRAAGADEEVRREVQSLLASHRAAPGGFVQQRIRDAVESFHRTTEVTGTRIGPYRLIRELGRGGMGTVFLAERDDNLYQATVAIKLVRPGMDTEFVLARFRRERQTLARLQHPNISHLLDGGTTDEGLPYIVMEYIDGPWITAYAAQHAVGIADRLRMFMEVCSAVDYAHRNFIVHRDLKPGNIVVNQQGVPKLLDFGICKLLVGESFSSTDTQSPPMTPSYASPEQLRGEAATISSDVYSLGAVLYELLTGRCPRKFDGMPLLAIHKALDTPVPPPSRVAGDRRMARQLAGDLDNILLRALEPEPQRRYESAAQFAEDLRRHLDNEPLRAHAQTWTYRSMKFVRRHRAPMIAAACVSVAILAGLGFSLYQARIATQRSQQIRTLANKLVFDLHDAIDDLPGSTKARQIVVETGVQYLDSLVESARGDPHAEKDLAKAYRQLGDVRGNEGSANLGDLPAALADYQKAVPLLESALRKLPGDIEARAEQIVLRNRIASIQASGGKLADALRSYEEAIRLGSANGETNDAAFRGALAAAYLGASTTKRNLGDSRGASEGAAESIRLYTSVGAKDPATTQSLASAYAALGMSETMMGRLDEALANFRRVTAMMETLVGTQPQNMAWNRNLMLAYGHIADVLGNPDLPSLGDRPGALAAYRQAAGVGKRLYEADPANFRGALDYGIVLSRVETVMDDKDKAEKIAVQRESLRVLDKALETSPTNLSLLIYRALINLHLGDTLASGGQLDAARDAYLKTVAIAGPGLESGHASVYVMMLRANQKLAVNAVARGRRADALSFAERTLKLSENPPAKASGAHAAPRGLSAMGLTYAALARSPSRVPGDLELAKSWLQRAADAWHAAQAKPEFATPHRREMHEVETTLAELEKR